MFQEGALKVVVWQRVEAMRLSVTGADVSDFGGYITRVRYFVTVKLASIVLYGVG